MGDLRSSRGASLQAVLGRRLANQGERTHRPQRAPGQIGPNHCPAAAARGPARRGLARALRMPWRCKKRRSACCPSIRKIEQVTYSNTPPGATVGHRASSSSRLRARQRGHVLRTAQPAHVGMAPHDARGAARRIEQHGVETVCRPTSDRRRARRRTLAWPAAAGVAGSVARAAGERHRRRARCTFRSANSSNCAVLPPGAAQASSTRAPVASRRIQQQRRGALRRQVLHRHVAFGKAGQLHHRARAQQATPRCGPRPGPCRPLAARRCT